MKFELPPTNACSQLNHATLDGYQVSQSLAAFIICRSLLQTLPDTQVVYDGKPCGETLASPNLFIWQDGAVPVLQFVGHIVCEPHDAIADFDQAKALEAFAAVPEAYVLDRDPVLFEYCDKQMKLAANPELALLFVHDRNVKMRYWTAGGSDTTYDF